MVGRITITGAVKAEGGVVLMPESMKRCDRKQAGLDLRKNAVRI